VLLRVEIAAFHPATSERGMPSPKKACAFRRRLVSVALIRTSRWTGVTRYAALCSPDLPPVRPFGPALARRLADCTSGGLVCFTNLAEPGKAARVMTPRTRSIFFEEV
ncbi:hypothetical protein, partial [Ideonella sp. B508-1]|uniref:hypothetical protein n=1 Tax=Ideonella sp. B508-1 TaxID=137716 RepID=UPI001F3B27F6